MSNECSNEYKVLYIIKHKTVTEQEGSTAIQSQWITKREQGNVGMNTTDTMNYFSNRMWRSIGPGSPPERRSTVSMIRHVVRAAAVRLWLTSRLGRRSQVQGHTRVPAKISPSRDRLGHLWWWRRSRQTACPLPPIESLEAQSGARGLRR